MMGINAATQYRFVYVNLDDFVHRTICYDKLTSQ